MLFFLKSIIDKIRSKYSKRTLTIFGVSLIVLIGGSIGLLKMEYGADVVNPNQNTVQKYGGLAGQLIDDKGTPLANFEVIIGSKSIMSGDDGGFLVLGIPVGLQQIMFFKGVVPYLAKELVEGSVPVTEGVIEMIIYTLYESEFTEQPEVSIPPLQSTIKIISSDSSVKLGSSIKIKTEITNTGTETWKKEGDSAGCNAFHLRTHAYPPSGPVVFNLGTNGAVLPKDIAPNETLTMDLEISTGTDKEIAVTGNYRIEVDMVKECVKWFSNQASVNVTVDPSSPPPAAIPVAQWKFEQNLDDSSSNKFNGVATIANSIGWSRDKIEGSYAGLFNDTNSCAIFGAHPELETKDITVSVWVKLDKTRSAGKMRLVANSTHGTNNKKTDGWVIQYLGDLSPGKMQFAYGNNSNSWGGTYVLSSVDPGDYQWHFVTGTLSTTNKKISIYIDGVLSGQSDYTGTPALSNKPIEIGCWKGNDRYFDGLIDDVRVYNTALSADEIKGLYQNK